MIELTYKQLTDTLISISSAHYNVAYSDAGVLENLNYGDINYPLVFFINQNITYQINTMTYNMIMLVGNFTNENLLQQTKIQSDMLEVTKDIISFLINGDYNLPWTVDENTITSTPFVDNLPDLITGYQTNFSLILPYDNSGCIQSFNPSELPTF
jgi:hypothetical protein